MSRLVRSDRERLGRQLLCVRSLGGASVVISVCPSRLTCLSASPVPGAPPGRTRLTFVRFAAGARAARLWALARGAEGSRSRYPVRRRELEVSERPATRNQKGSQRVSARGGAVLWPVSWSCAVRGIP